MVKRLISYELKGQYLGSKCKDIRLLNFFFLQLLLIIDFQLVNNTVSTHDCIAIKKTNLIILFYTSTPLILYRKFLLQLNFVIFCYCCTMVNRFIRIFLYATLCSSHDFICMNYMMSLLMHVTIYIKCVARRYHSFSK